MKNKEEITRILQENYPYLASEYGVKRIGLFGSYSRDIPDEDSDIDLIVEFDHPIGFRFAELAEYLEKILGKSVDLLTPAGLQGIRIKEVADSIREDTLYV